MTARQCEPWHKHRTDDLLACGLAGMSHEEFLAFTKKRCREIAEQTS